MDLFEHAVARRSDPRTSWDAADSVKNIRESQAFILDLLSTYGPMTDEEIYKLLGEGYSPSGARSRRNELVEKGLVQDSGRRALTKSNRRTIIWRAV